MPESGNKTTQNAQFRCDCVEKISRVDNDTMLEPKGSDPKKDEESRRMEQDTTNLVPIS